MPKLTSYVFVAVLSSGSIGVQALPSEEHQEIVGWSDLDLNKPAGTEVLYRRILQAARDVCSDLEGSGLDRSNAHKKCLEAAIGRAIDAVKNPSLSYYAQRHGRLVRTVSRAETPTKDKALVLTAR